jgi:two-component system chemotaxis sensor kinase CheA
MNNVGELVILQTVLSQHQHLFQSVLVQKTVSQLAKITKEIQEVSMSLRMVPLRQTFQKMQRIVRDTSKALGKEVNLVLGGEDTEIDKTLVDNLNDPLVHLIQNAVDHGIESLEARRAKGKPDVGTLSLTAFHRGNSIVIEVRDDGAGLDAQKLRVKATEKGILKPNQVLTDAQARLLIFAPGFSTKSEVSEISGRGVGMDVVKTNVERLLHGSIEIDTEVGKGTCFRVVLPLTLAIIDGMVASAGDARYIIPLSHVQESIQPKKEDISYVTGMGEILNLRGASLPLYRLSSVLGHAPKTDGLGIAIVVSREGAGTSDDNGSAESSAFSVMVDEILGQQQVVIKQLGREIRNLRGVSGGAILGDGKVALILDLGELVGSKNVTVRGVA